MQTGLHNHAHYNANRFDCQEKSERKYQEEISAAPFKAGKKASGGFPAAEQAFGPAGSENQGSGSAFAGGEATDNLAGRPADDPSSGGDDVNHDVGGSQRVVIGAFTPTRSVPEQ